MAPPDREAAAQGPATAVRIGTVYGTLLNLADDLAHLDKALHEPPYKAPPRAPVLYIKPPGSYAPQGARVVMPEDCATLEASAVLAAVIGRTATRVRKDSAASFVRGFTIGIDITMAHRDLYRPPIAERCRDGFMPLGPRILATEVLPDPVTIALMVNGRPAQSYSSADFARPLDVLLEDVTDFMTLFEGDVLLLGVPLEGVMIRGGDRITAEIGPIGRLEVTMQAEAAVST